jgi:hypothetical protein
VVDLSMEDQRQQAAEDARPLPRNDEARLAALLSRAGRRSARREVLNFSACDEAEPGPVTGEANCGPSDPLNNICLSRYHDPSCGSMASGEVTGALRPVLRGGNGHRSPTS